MILALIGNQNSGKTTLFNRLTGARRQVGNFPGVTVDQALARSRQFPDVEILDLPGIYSLSPYSSEERISRDALMSGRVDGILNIVDATNLERNLYLTLQLIDLGLPMTLALNMMDEVEQLGRSIDVAALEEALGIPVIPIVASNGRGVTELMRRAHETTQEKRRPLRPDLCSGPVHRALHAIAAMIEDHAERCQVTPRYAATKIIEGDELLLPRLGLNENELDACEHIITEMERELGTDRLAALADMRYSFIQPMVAQVTQQHADRSEMSSRTARIDRVLTHRILALPLFILIMSLIFWISFGPIGLSLSDGFADWIAGLGQKTAAALTTAEVNPVVVSLVEDGVFGGVGSVLSFLPMILLLFTLLGLLEDSGYMARIAFFMDRLLQHIGLSGSSFVPMLLGFGCTVPAVMATRTLPSRRDRLLTVLLVPFMSCSAKVPVYALLASVFFPRCQTLVIVGLYALGMLLAVASGLILRNTVFLGDSIPFVLELPPYRFPSLQSVWRDVAQRAKDFMTRAFTVIFVVTLLIWFLETFDPRLNVAGEGDSILAALGRLAAPLFAPLGFGDWRVVSAVISGFSAKEAVISALRVATSGMAGGFEEALKSLLTAPAAFSLLVFVLLYTPCSAAVAAMAREIRIRFSLPLIVLFQTVYAWVIAFFSYRFALYFADGLYLRGILTLLLLVAAWLGIFLASRRRKPNSMNGKANGK
ncbi:MAG: ferrous iron transport protein B [Bacillota bacterium]|nr:ferrous iron transport protein B [Bacillota bacterium]